MTVDTDVQVRERRGIRALAIGLFLAPVAFAVHLQLAYMDVRHECRHESAMRFHVESVVALLLALTGAAVAYRSWSAAGRRWPSDRADRDSRSSFLAVTGLLLSLMMALDIVAQWLPVFFLHPCQ
jgi:hypothetical protein